MLVFTALGLVTFVTWRLLIGSADARMRQELRFEVEQFGELAGPGVNPRTGATFTSVDEVIREAIAYNLAKPNEKFLGYVGGVYRTQSRQVTGAQPSPLPGDADFTRLVASVTEPAQGRYQDRDLARRSTLPCPSRWPAIPHPG